MTTERQREWHREHRLRKRALVYEEFLRRGGVCLSCGTDDYRLIEWHHVDPRSKTAAISDLITSAGRERLMAELVKCDPICRSCHREHHRPV